jgi:hypothetical protein
MTSIGFDGDSLFSDVLDGEVVIVLFFIKDRGGTSLPGRQGLSRTRGIFPVPLLLHRSSPIATRLWYRFL